jgi:hypothetical protein
MRKLLLLISAPVLFLVLSLGPLAGPAQAATRVSPGQSTSRDFVGGFCDDGSAGYCIRDPSGGGPGTEVLMSAFGTDEDRTWDIGTDYGECDGVVGDGCPNSQLSNRYSGDPILTFTNDGSLYCMGADADSGWVAEMKTCDELNGAFIWNIYGSGGCNGDYCYVISVDYSVANGQIAWLCGSNTNDDPATVTTDCDGSGLAEWAEAVPASDSSARVHQ